MPRPVTSYVCSCTKCVQVSLGEMCKFLHPSCIKTCNAFALHVFMQLGCTQYETHKFLRKHVQRKSVAHFHATLLRGTCTNLHGACTELACKLVKFCTNLQTLIFWHLSKKIHSHQISPDTKNSHLLHIHNTQHKTSPDYHRRRCLFRRCLRARQPPPPLLQPCQSPADDDDDEG